MTPRIWTPDRKIQLPGRGHSYHRDPHRLSPLDYHVFIPRPNCPGIFAGGGGGGGGTGAFRSSQPTLFGATATCAADMPAGVASGDYLLAFAVMDSGGSTWSGIPVGWTEIDNGTLTPDGARWSLAVRVAGGSEPANYTWTNVNALNAVIIIGAWQNINAVTPRTFETPTTNNTSNASPITLAAAGGTAALNDCIAYFATIDKIGATGAYSYTPPAGYTKRNDTDNGWVSSGLFTLDNSPAGATGTINATATGAENGGYATVVVALATA